MAAISLCIIDRDNKPLYMREFGGDDETTAPDLASEEHIFYDTKPNTPSTASECSIRHQFILHAALDRYEQLAGPPPGHGWRKAGVTGADAMFVGLLCPVEEMRVYGTKQ